MLTQARDVYEEQVAGLLERIENILAGQQVNQPVELVTKLEGMVLAKLQGFYIGTSETTPWNVAIDVEPVRGIDAAGKKTGPPLLSYPLIQIATKGVCMPTVVNFAPVSDPAPKEWVITGADCEGAKALSLELAYYPTAAEQLFSLVYRFIQSYSDRPGSVRRISSSDGLPERR
jgi:hypothetical protein